MSEKKRWDGKAKGSVLGNYIFIKIIEAYGPFPAYALLCLVTWHYVFFDHPGIQALKKFRKKAGFKNTNIFHLFKHFSAFGMVLIDRVTYSVRKNPPFTFTFVNDNYISETLARGKGAILLSAHIGNWEIAGNLLAARFDNDICAVLLDNEKPEIKEIFKSVTDNRRFSTITMTDNILDVMIPIKETLRNNGIVCFLADRFISSSKTIMRFFGEEASFPTGPFEIAAITGTTILPVFSIKDSLTHFTTKSFRPITFENITKENRQERIQLAMETFTTILEEVAKKNPYQWFNFFDVWERT